MRKLNRSDLPSYQFWGLLATFAGLFLLGGSARDDVQSLAVLNPAMILCCGVALLTLKHEHWRDKKWFFVIFALVFLLIAIYGTPLPLPIEPFSQGARNVAAVGAFANVSNSALFLGVAPTAVWPSIFFLFGPLAVFLFAIQLNRDDFLLTLPMMIWAGSISGVIGLLQIVGSADGPLYFYRITNNGSAVGLFANRNHAAALLASLFPMLAVFAVRSRTAVRGGKSAAQLVAITIAITLIPLILVTGARSGIIGTIFGLFGAVALYNSRVHTHRGAEKARSLAPILGMSAVLCIALATIYFSRATALERMFAETTMINSRTDFWAASLKLFWQYFPLGFGPGSFVPVFQNQEPLALLNGSYLNRLHNDWLEFALTFGVPGILLMLVGLTYFVWRSFLLWFRMDGARSAVAFGRMASVIIIILGIASMSDYPLRTPAMMGFAMLTLLWFGYARREPKGLDNPSS